MGPSPVVTRWAFSRSRPQHAGEREGDRRLERPADPGPDGHTKARHRNTDPASATTAPAARSATLPIGHRCTAPIAMPRPCRAPVATTNPRLYMQAVLARRAAPSRARDRGRWQRLPRALPRPRAPASLRGLPSAPAGGPRARCRSRRRARGRRAGPGTRRRPSPSGRSPGAARPRAGRVARPRGRRRPSPARGPDPRSDAASPFMSPWAWPPLDVREGRRRGREERQTSRGCGPLGTRDGPALARAGRSSHPTEQDQRPLNRPVGAQRSHGVTRAGPRRLAAT